LEEGLQLAKDFKCLYYETSAKTGENIDLVFKDLSQLLINDNCIDRNSYNSFGSITRESNDGIFGSLNRKNSKYKFNNWMINGNKRRKSNGIKKKRKKNSIDSLIQKMKSFFKLN
jgi:hypothetical protein